MTSERWHQIKSVLAAVLEQPVEERTIFLAQACNGDDGLRAEVESLMAHQEPGDSIAGSANISPQISLARAIGGHFLLHEWPDDEGSADDLAEIERVGPYRILRELGRGGVGTVFLAERDDEQYRQRVAVKLIRRGMDTDFVMRRFRNERQILAALDHPNIARLLDGGATEDGRPYLVMEHVEGLPISIYCDQHTLNTEERLELFQQVCAAVHYAHQHLVIHRDIKPSNILVTKEGVPKLLDFGIAKLLTPELAAQTLDPTLTAMRLLTPAYASPEQIKGASITTATDVYSLGVLLHELLTGHKPYRVDSHAALEMMQAVLEKEATKPSAAIMHTETRNGHESSASTTLTPESISKSRGATPDRLSRQLRGDLDNIVLTALRKDPQRRYASVQELSEDIRRHLKGLPVNARADTFGYRAAKFVGRNKISVAAAAIVMLTLIAGIIAVNQQRQRAERRFDDVRKLAHSVVFDYHDAIANLPGSTTVRQRMVRDALEYLDSLANEAAGDRSLQRELASAYQKIGDVQGNSNMANLGDTAGALISYRKSLAIRQSLLRSDAANSELQSELVDSYQRIGDVLHTAGDVSEASKHYEQAVTLLEKIAAPADQSRQRKLADLLYRVGNLKGNTRFSNLGDTKGAVEFHNRGLAIREALAKANPLDLDLNVDLAESLRSVANLLATSASDLARAEPHARQAVLIATSMVSQEPTHARALRVLTEAQDALARVLLRKGQTVEAFEVCLGSLRNAERLLALDPSNMQARQDLASGHTLAGNIYERKGDSANALKQHQRALIMYEAIVADDPTNESAKRWMAQSHLTVGMDFRSVGNLASAIKHNRQAVAVLESLYQAKPSDIQTIQFIARAYSHTGETLAKMGDLKGALAEMRRSLDFAGRAMARDSENHLLRRLVAMTYFNVGDVYGRLAEQQRMTEQQRLEHWREARKAYQQSLDLFTDLRNRGVLPKEFTDKPNEISVKIAACEAAMAKKS